jgi:hypothetical protein
MSTGGREGIRASTLSAAECSTEPRWVRARWVGRNERVLHSPEQVVDWTEREASLPQLVFGAARQQQCGNICEDWIRAEALQVVELGAAASTEVDQDHVGPPSRRVWTGVTNVCDRAHSVAVQLQLHPIHLGDIGIAGNQQNLAAFFGPFRDCVDHASIVIIPSEMEMRAA